MSEQSMNDMIAIDFGTTRTKLAYFDPITSKPQVHRLGMENAIPSIFYVEIGDGKVNYLTGEKAANRYYLEPKYGFDKVKLRMSENLRVAPPRTDVSQVDLLRTLFQELRERAGREISIFSEPPKGVQLTQTEIYGISEREILKEAAKAAGFDRIEMILEPEAAAQLWLSETVSDIYDVIVLDFGGGTLDWTYMHREGDRYKTNVLLRPGGEKVGGENIDNQLLEYVRSRLRSRGVDLDEKDVPGVRQEVRACKEQYCDDLIISEIEIRGEFIELTGEEIQSAINSSLITPACNVIGSYIKEVKEVTRRKNLDILLVGGCSRVKGLKEQIESKFACKVFTWDRAEFAPVLGAALLAYEKNKDSVDQHANHKGAYKDEGELDKIEITYFKKGQELLDSRDYSDALNAFEKALQQNLNNPDIHIGMSRAHCELGSLEDAAKHARVALKLNPNLQLGQEVLRKIKDAYLERGAIQIENEDYESAAAQFNKALVIDPEDGKVDYLRAGIAKMGIEQYQAALSRFKIALAIDTKDAQIHAYIAITHLRLNDLPNAKKSARASLKCDAESKLAKKVLQKTKELQSTRKPQIIRDFFRTLYIDILYCIRWLIGRNNDKE